MVIKVKINSNSLTCRYGIKDRVNSSGKDFGLSPVTSLPSIIEGVKRLIRSAKREIVIGIYLWGKPDILEELKEAARRGVDVKVVVDPYGYEDSGPGDDVIEELREAGVKIYKYPADKLPQSLTEKLRRILSKLPIKRLRRYSHSRPKYHIKAVVVDRKRVYIGSGNFEEDGWKQCYDTGLIGEDEELAGILREAIIRDYNLASKGIEAPNRYLVDFKGNKFEIAFSPEREALKELIIKQIDSAKRSIDIEMYVLAEVDVVKALMRAARRGVDVKVLVNVFSDNKLFQFMNKAVAEKLMRSGVQVKQIVPTEDIKWFHSKLAVIDSKRYIITTGNWSVPGFKRNRETGVAVSDPNGAKVFEHNFEKLWNRPEYRSLNGKLSKTFTEKVSSHLGWIALEVAERAGLL